MPRATSLCLLTVACGTWIAIGLDSPQGRLLTHVAMGRFTQPPVPVSAFTPVAFDEEVVPVRLGALTLSVPRGFMLDNRHDTPVKGEGIAFYLQGSDLGFAVFRPRSDGSLAAERDSGLKAMLPPGMDEVAIECAAYVADPGKASVWMSGDEASQLDGLLTLRNPLYGAVERVEYVRGESLNGILFIRDLGDDRTGMLFDYFSTDGVLNGTAVLTLDARSESAMKTARAIFSSFRILPDASSRPDDMANAYMMR